MKNSFKTQGDLTVIYLVTENGVTYETIIDTVDLERVKEFPNTWRVTSVTKVNSCRYVKGTISVNCKKKTVLLHRWILNPPSELNIDHINHDTLNNRRNNLRVCSSKENSWNRRLSISNKSGTQGVCCRGNGSKWTAQILINGKQKHLGSFGSIEEAIATRKNAEMLYHGDIGQRLRTGRN